MKTPYNNDYYKTQYVESLQVKFNIANIYYLWIAYFCLIQRAKLKKGSKVLDVGCGIGNLVWALRKFGIKAYGLEPSKAAQKFSRVPQYCKYGVYKKIPYRSSEFDLVYTNEVLEHISNQQLNRNLLDMSRVSKENMIHIIGVKERGKMITEDPTHLTIKNEKWWEKKFKSLNLQVKAGDLFYFFPFIFSSKVNLSGIKKGYFFISKSKK